MKPTKNELIFYNRLIDRIFMFELQNIDRIKNVISDFKNMYGDTIRYRKIEKLFNERVNFLTPNSEIKRVKEITQDEWESNMKDSIINQLEWEDNL